MDLKRFDLPKFVDSLKDLSLLEVIESCRKEYSWAETRLSKATRDEQYHIRNYYHPIRDFVWFVGNNGLPATTGKEGMIKFKPVVESLIEKGQMNPEVLKLLE